MWKHRSFMEIITWNKISRKRSNLIPHDSPDFNRGYDLDMADFTALVGKYNDKTLTHTEEERLYLYVMTMINIVLENPKLNPTKVEMDALTDAMFLDGWNALHYIKDGRKPYSYIYRSMYTAACRYYKKVIKDREKKEQLNQWIDDAYAEYMESVGTGKTPRRKTLDSVSDGDRN